MLDHLKAIPVMRQPQSQASGRLASVIDKQLVRGDKDRQESRRGHQRQDCPWGLTGPLLQGQLGI